MKGKERGKRMGRKSHRQQLSFQAEARRDPAHIFPSSHLYTSIQEAPWFWRLTLSTDIMAGGPLVTLGPRWHGLRRSHQKLCPHPPGSPLTSHNGVCLRA